MSIKMMSAVWDSAPFEQTTLLVLLALADSAHDDGKCWPSIATIAHKARCSERWCRRVLIELEQAGWVTRNQRSGTSNMYHVVIPTPEPQARTDETAGVAPEPSKGWSADPLTPELGASQTVKNRKSNRKCGAPHPIPDDFVLSPAMRSYCLSKLPGWNVELEFESFLNKHREKGTEAKDWEASWRYWVTNAVKYNAERQAKNPAPAPDNFWTNNPDFDPYAEMTGTT